MVETQVKANSKEMAAKQDAAYKIVVKGISEVLDILCSICADNSTCPHKQPLKERIEKAASIKNPFMQMIASNGAKELVAQEIMIVVGQGKYKELEPKIDAWYEAFSKETEAVSDIVKISNPLQVYKEHPEAIEETILKYKEEHREGTEKETAAYKGYMESLGELKAIICGLCPKAATCEGNEKIRKGIEERISTTKFIEQQENIAQLEAFSRRELGNLVGQGLFKELEPKVSTWFKKWEPKIKEVDPDAGVCNPLGKLIKNPALVTKMEREYQETKAAEEQQEDELEKLAEAIRKANEANED